MQMQTYYKRNKTLFVDLICIVTNLSYYPIFVSSGNGRLITLGMWGILFVALLARGKLFVKGTNVLTGTLFLYVVFILNLVISTCVSQKSLLSNHFFLPVSIAVGILLAGNALGKGWNRSDFQKLCTVYMYSILSISVFVFLFYLRGTDFSTSLYGYSFGKNEITVLFLCANAIACILYKPTAWWQRLCQVATITFCTIDIIMLRSRSVMFGMLILILTVIFFAKSINKRIRILIILTLVAAVVFLSMHQDIMDIFMKQFIFAGREYTDLNTLSSGRGDQISLGLEVFRNNWLSGAGARQTLDCFYVSALANFGLLCWPLVILSVMPMAWSIINIKKNGEFAVLFFVIAASFFVLSLLEELAPFGPGTRCYFLWMMWGILMQFKKRKLYG